MPQKRQACLLQGRSLTNKDNNIVRRTQVNLLERITEPAGQGKPELQTPLVQISLPCQAVHKEDDASHTSHHSPRA